MTAVRLDPYQNIIGVSWGGVQLGVTGVTTEGSVPPNVPGFSEPWRFSATLYEDINPVYEWGGQVIGRSGVQLTDVWQAKDLEGVNLAWAYWAFKIFSGSTSGVAYLVALNFGKIFAQNPRGNRCVYRIINSAGNRTNEVTRDQLARETAGASKTIFPGSPWVQRGTGGALLGLANTGPSVGL